MKYKLHGFAGDRQFSHELTQGEFDTLVKARQTLITFSAITENYRVVLEAYKTLEKAKHDTGLDHMIYGFSKHAGILNTRVSLNFATLAYLAAARYFLDSSDRLITAVASADESRDFDLLRSSIYDTEKEYRFIEALRNYVQHRALPVDWITYHNFIENTKDIPASDLVTAVSLQIKREKLALDPKFKKAVLDGMPETIDIVEGIRAHMSGIWRLHEFAVKNCGHIASEARNAVSESITKVKDALGRDISSLYAISESESGDAELNIPILLDWDDARLEAIRNLGALTNLKKRYITGKIQKKA